MFENKEIQKNLGLQPFNTFSIILSIVSSIFGIVGAIVFLKPLLAIIVVLLILLIFSSGFLWVAISRLKKMKYEYDETILSYNKLLDEYSFANENREKLIEIIDEKNEEIKLLKNETIRLGANVQMLWFFYLKPIEQLPDQETIKNALQINKDKVINND